MFLQWEPFATVATRHNYLKFENNIFNIEELINLIENVLSNEKYLEKLNNRKNNWIEISNTELKKEIIIYLNSLSMVEV